MTRRVSLRKIHSALEGALLESLDSYPLSNSMISNAIANTPIDLSGYTLEEILSVGIDNELILPDMFVMVKTSQGYALLSVDENRNLATLANTTTAISYAGSGDHSFNPVEGTFLLTNAWQVVSGDWSENSTPVGGSLDSATGIFTITATGRWNISLERIYHNHDTNPTEPIMVYIKIQADIGDGNGWVDTPFNRSSIISAATNNDEPAILPFTSPFNFDIGINPTLFRILVKADEDGATPDQVELAKMKIVGNIVGNIP